MFNRSKTPRTKIVDLPETPVRLTEEELRLVSGGLRSRFAGCNVAVAFSSGDPTNVITNGDWDTD